ncbi:MAG: metallophosphoesterase family protein [Campylobacterota bacterium]|nr:metallophosphoesterase family protein [Campylobacterota bacterium]
MSHKLLESAIIVGDVHYDKNHREFLTLLDDILSSKIVTSQLILLGDIFDLLFGEVEVTHVENMEAIKRLFLISKTVEVIYFEGNHDFNLDMIFKDSSIKTISIQNQPMLFTCNKKRVYLSHGDNNSDLQYTIFTTILRSHLVMSLLALINKKFNNIVINKLNEHLSKKVQCKEFVNFKEHIEKRALHVKLEPCDYIVEGHYHQNRSFKFNNFEYINIGAFACNQRYFVVQSSNRETFLKEECV